jgi:hypothetical protein
VIKIPKRHKNIGINMKFRKATSNKKIRSTKKD